MAFPSFLKAITPVFNNTTTTISLPYSVAVGDSVFVYVSLNTNQSLSYTISDDGANHYNPGPIAIFTNLPATVSFYLLSAPNPATTITITVSSQPTSSWTASAASYSNVGNIGFTGNVNGATAANLKAIAGSLHATANIMSAALACRSVSSMTAVSGILRASSLTNTTLLGLMDNTGSLSLTCSYTTTQTGVYSGVFIELQGTTPTPVLNIISPNTAAVVNPTFTVTFHGSGLTGTTAVNVGGAPILVSNISVINDTTVIANFSIPEGAATGTFNISLTTPGGTSNTLPFTLTLRPQGQAIFYDRVASQWAFKQRRRR